MPDTRERERLAVLEERSETQRDQIGELVDALHTLTVEVTRIGQRMEHNMGFWGGIAFAFSMFGTIVGMFGSVITQKIVG